MKTIYIQTTFGKRALARRIGVQGEYAKTLPRPNAPHGEWWVFNLQRGWVPITPDSKGLQAALAKEGVTL